MAKWKALQCLQDGTYHTGYVGDVAYQRNKTYVEVDVPVFEDTLTFEGFSRGRSAAIVHLKGLRQSYQTGLDGFERLVPRMTGGKISGAFTLRKQGQQIYLFPVEDKS